MPRLSDIVTATVYAGAEEVASARGLSAFVTDTAGTAHAFLTTAAGNGATTPRRLFPPTVTVRTGPDGHASSTSSRGGQRVAHVRHCRPRHCGNPLLASMRLQGQNGASYALSRKNFSSPPPLALYWQFTVPPGPVAVVTPLPVTMRRKMFGKVTDSKENEPSGWARARNFS